MAIHTLDLSSLDELAGGKVAILFRRALAQALEDCRQRPADETKRKVVITAFMVPVLHDDERELAEVDVSWKVDATVPSRLIQATRMAARPDNTLVFNDLSPDDPRQGTLDDLTNHRPHPHIPATGTET